MRDARERVRLGARSAQGPAPSLGEHLWLVAGIAGIRAFAVHAKDEEARKFYESFDFVPSPTDPMHLFVLLQDVRRIISKQ